MLAIDMAADSALLTYCLGTALVGQLGKACLTRSGKILVREKNLHLRGGAEYAQILWSILIIVRVQTTDIPCYGVRQKGGVRL